MAAEDLYTLEIGALLHDEGKIGETYQCWKTGPLENRNMQSLQSIPQGRKYSRKVNTLKIPPFRNVSSTKV
jgi:hypothetical protein